MNETTIQHLKMLEAAHPKKITATKGRLRVFYGFSKINKIQLMLTVARNIPDAMLTKADNRS